MSEIEKTTGGFTVAGFIGFVLIGFITLCLWGCPKYFVYEQQMSGEAELAKATFNRQVKVREAEATKEASTLLAGAEVERAKGIAQANKIIGESLKDHKEYLNWLYIEALKDNKNAQVIYVPTEAGIPILEAGKRKMAEIK
jgi:regulator of protease activity HflC (stomatin/prohibitin superfamily)